MSLDTTPRMFATVTGVTATYRHPDGRLEALVATPGRRLPGKTGRRSMAPVATRMRSAQ